MKNKFDTGLITVGIELMLFISCFDAVLPSICRYLDDFFCAFMALLLVVNIFAGKRVFKFYFLILLLAPIGLMGNLVYDIQPNFLLAVTDAFMFLKPYILLMYIAANVSVCQAKKIYITITKLSKIIISVLACFSILSSLFKDTFYRMFDAGGYFTFYSGFTGTIAMTVVLCVAIISSNTKNKRYNSKKSNNK